MQERCVFSGTAMFCCNMRCTFLPSWNASVTEAPRRSHWHRPVGKPYPLVCVWSHECFCLLEQWLSSPYLFVEQCQHDKPKSFFRGVSGEDNHLSPPPLGTATAMNLLSGTVPAPSSLNKYNRLLVHMFYIIPCLVDQFSHSHKEQYTLISFISKYGSGNNC